MTTADSRYSDLQYAPLESQAILLSHDATSENQPEAARELTELLRGMNQTELRQLRQAAISLAMRCRGHLDTADHD